MPALLIALGILVFALQPTFAAAAEAAAAVNQFLADPLDSDPRPILKFAEESQTHEITLLDKYLPWMSEEPQPVGSPLLLAGFLAGNLQAQFQKNTGQPQPYAGALGIITVYRKIQDERPDYRVPSIEHFIDLEKKGRLKAYIEQPEQPPHK